MLQIAICDDEPAFVARVRGLTQRFFAAQGQAAELHCFTSATAFAQSDLAAYGLVLLDVLMQEMDGIQAAKALRAQNRGAILIFLSAYIDYAIMGYKVHAFSYLLKEDLCP